MSTSTDPMTTLAWSLLHFLWQGAAIAALAAAAMQLFRESTTRYLVGISALVLMCMSFGVTFTLLAGAPAAGAEAAADTAAMRSNADASAVSLDVAPAALPPGSVTLSLEKPAAPRDFAWVARGWLAGVGLLALRVACGLLLLEYLRRRNLTALPIEIVERLRALQQRLGIARVVRYCECRLVAVPSVIGFFRPIVLLPVRALTGLSADELDAVIAHELGHVKRFDVAVNFLQVVVETLFFFHPAVWWLNKRIRADREDCCDDIAIAACGRTVSYARALATMEDWRGTPALSMAVTGGDVASRVARLLGMSRQPAGVHAAAGVFTAALVLAAALTAGAASIGIARPSFSQLAQLEPLAELAQLEPLAELAQLEPLAQLAQLERLAQLAQVRPLAQAGPENRSRREATRAQTDAPRGPSYIDELKAAGFDVTDIDQLIAAKIHGVTGDYVRQVRDAGLDPDSEELIAMKIHRVAPENVAAFRAMGLDPDLDEVMAMTIHGVTPEYIAQIRANGLEPDIDQVMAMKIHGVVPEDVAQFRAAGLDPDLDQVIAMRIHGVRPEDVTRFRAMGFEVDTDDVIALRIHGVTPEFIDEARSRGFEDLTLDQIIRLKNADVL